MTLHARIIRRNAPPPSYPSQQRRHRRKALRAGSFGLSLLAPRPIWDRLARWTDQMNDMTSLLITAVAGALVTGSAASVIMLSGTNYADLPDMTWPEVPPACHPLPFLPDAPTGAVPDGLGDITGPPPVCVIMLSDAH